MSIESTVPIATIDAGGSSPVGGATLHGVTSDLNPATYIELEGDASIIQMDPPTGTPLAYGIVIGADKGSGAAATIEITTNGTEPRTLRRNVSWTGPLPVSFGGVGQLGRGAFDPADPRITIRNTTGFTLPHVTEIVLLTTVVDPAVVVVEAPAGTLTTTNRPTVEWVFLLDADAGGQTHYEVKIFDDATFDAGGFDPDVDEPVLESGVLIGNDLSWQPDDILDNATYHAMVRIAQTFAGDQIWSDWSEEEFVINTFVPGAPSLSLVPEGERYRMRLDVQPASVYDQFGFEDDGAQFTNTGSGTEKARVVTLLDQDAQQGQYMLAVTVDGSGTNRGITGATVATSTTSHEASVYVLAESGVAGHLYLDERSGSSTVDTVSTAFTGTGEWQRVSASNAFSTGDGVRIRVLIDAAVATSFGIDGVQIIGGTQKLTDYLQVQKRQSGTETWLDLRTKVEGGLITDAETAYDAEAPNGYAMEYRARAIHAFTETELSYTDWVAASDFVVWDEWTIKHPYNPELNMAIIPRSQPSRRKVISATVHHALGRTSPVVIRDAQYCWEGTLVIRCDTDSARTQLQEIIEDGSPLLVQAPNTDSWKGTWMALVDEFSQERVIDNANFFYTFDTLNWVQVQRPLEPLNEWPTYFVPSAEEDE